MKSISRYHKAFDNVRQQTELGWNFWFVRDLQSIFEYSRWDKFNPIILKTIRACGNSEVNPLGIIYVTTNRVRMEFQVCDTSIFMNRLFYQTKQARGCINV